MANARDESLKAWRRNERRLERMGDDAVRELAGAYERARRELRDSILDRWELMGTQGAPDLRRLARDIGLLDEIERILAGLYGRLGEQMSELLPLVDELGLEGALAELATLADALGVTLPDPALVRGVDRLAVQLVSEAVGYIPTLRQAQGAAIIAEMRTALAAGESVPQMVRRVLAREGSAWARGRTSAELFIRRGVIEVFNASKEETYQAVAETSLPGLQKQALATVSARTTLRCLDVHGQIRPLDKPFQLSGNYSGFPDRMMRPPFHWNCRTSIAAYMPDFEEGSRQTTASMRREARAARAARGTGD